MKKLNLITAFLIGATILVSSCSDDFFDTAPSDDLTDSEVFSSTKNIDALINGTIRYLMENATSQDNPGFGAIMLTREVMGDDAIARDGVYGFRDSYPFRDPYDNTTRRALFFWTLQYKVIDNVNNILANTDQANGPENEKQWLKGQAYALRAFAYLNLVQQYQFTYSKDKNALAVPIYTEPTSPSSEGGSRATVEAVYNQVFADLQQAEQLLEGFNRTMKNRPNLQVVKGLLARAYLVTEQWALAAEKAREAREGFPLMSAQQYIAGFNDVSNVEWIWGHPQRAEQNLGGASFFAYIDVTPVSGYRSIMPDPYFWQLFDDADIRKSLFEFEDDPTHPIYRWLKYKKFINKPDRSGHIPLMRASEQALIEAESEARLGHIPEALDALNALRVNRNLPELTAADFSPDALIEEILLERRRELWGEGFRLTDILRLQRAVERKESTLTYSVNGEDLPIKGHYIRVFPDNSAFVPNSPYYLFPIPINEWNNNPNL
ncbi:RagB/SusD family nutrient uptake outer membrane protein [Parapedobacter deserti]|uniref:RagB/SusD family nutrient uptake outer membrane protein n=1 Tax=Parapedobacter deserti TaxID=1912957 RepID=A0ABV7JTQ2_9SPHI